MEPVPYVDTTPESATLAKFLERPVEIAQITWTSTDTINATLFQGNPWKLFLANPAVKNKIANYQLIKGDLHLKVLVNGSPFHYGMLVASYVPMSSRRIGLSARRGCMMSLPKVVMYPSSVTEAMLHAPFVSQKNWIDLSPVGYSGSLDEAKGIDLGELILTPPCVLRHANLAVAPSINISIFAWMDNVVLAVPTPYAVLEAGSSSKSKTKSVKSKKKKRRPPPQDEYDDSGPVSGIASAVAGIAGRLTDVPGIGPFARATQMGADAIGGIASLFGFSRPVALSGITRVKNEPYVMMATSAYDDSAAKLSLDPKQEGIIDPRMIGLPPDDSMLISHIAGREGIVNAATWTETDVPGTVLARIPVTPSGYEVYTNTIDLNLIYPTPLFWLTRAFAYWTGSLRYRIRIPATQYHRGRLRVSYFPRDSAILPAVDLSNTTWNVVLDVGEDQELEFEVPWTQACPWLGTQRVLLSATGTNVYTTNGVIVITVLNELQSPLATSTIDIVTCVEAGDDFKVAKPYAAQMQNYMTVGTGWTLPAGFTNPSYVGTLYNDTPSYNEWAGTTPAPVVLESGTIGDPVDDVSLFPSANFGEEIVSIRQLVKRSCLYTSITTNSFTGLQHSFLCLPTVPYDLTNSTAITGSKSYQTFLTWFRPGYLAVRGGSRYRFAFTFAASSDSTVSSTTNMLGQGTATAFITDSSCPYAGAPANDDFAWESANGAQLYATQTQAGIEVDVPYYYPLRFVQSGAASNPFWGVGSDQTEHTTPSNVGLLFPNCTTPDGVIGLESIGHVDAYVAGAEDMTFDFFVCPPALLEFISKGRDSTPL